MKKSIWMLLLSAATSVIYGQVDTSQSRFWMMTYFINRQDEVGARLAFSSDSTGVKWQKFNNEQAILKPIRVTGANDQRMRDPMIAYDSIHKRFNMIWTVSWTGKVIGWDTSAYLKEGTWGPQVGLPISEGIPNSSFSWAPEILWDDIQNKWMIYWSVKTSSTDTYMYYTMIDGWDFRNFSEPEVLIDPGIQMIDGSIIKVGERNYQMFFKDERNGEKCIRRAWGATTPQGPWEHVGDIVVNATTEGPTIYRAGGKYRLIADHYSNNGVSVSSVDDINTDQTPWPQTWCTFGNNDARFIASHCNVIEVPKMLVKWMLYNDSAWVKYVNDTTVNVEKLRPVRQMNGLERQGTHATMVDLLGKSVKINPLTREKGSRVPSGYRIIAEGEEIRAGVNVESNK